MFGENLRILVIVVPLLTGGLLGIFAAKIFSRANVDMLRALGMPDDLIRIAGNTLIIRVVGILALLTGLCLLVWRIAQD
jgi:hypothetical protein